MLWRNLNIAKLEMMNFKRFNGHHSLDLLTEPEKDKNLILIGAENGMGKTSIHEAINYAFYEFPDLPKITTKPDYLTAVSDRLNRKALDDGETEYWVALELIAFPQGTQRELRIERKWNVDLQTRKIVGSHLDIFENGRLIDWVGDEAYQDFLRSILPPTISPYFFFDGEKIQEFAEDENFERMKEGILDILHINVYRTLITDLKRHVIDAIEKNEIQPFENDDLYKLLEETERLEAEVQKKHERLEENKRDQDETHIGIKLLDEEVRRVARPGTPKRDALLTERAHADDALDRIKQAIDESIDNLPLLMAGKLLALLEGALLDEQVNRGLLEKNEILKGKISKIEKEVFGVHQDIPPEYKLSKQQSKLYRELFRDISYNVFELHSDKARPILHDIGSGERQRIIGRISTAQAAIPGIIENLDARERLNNDLRSIDNQLKASADDPQISEMLEKLGLLREKLGSLQQEQTTLEADLQRLGADLAKRRKQIEDRQSKREATTKAKKAIRLAQDAQKALNVFIKKLAPEKLSLLKDKFEYMYHLLRKPEDPVHKIEIDKDTWRIILYDSKNRPLEKRVFSAGMKQMYALSLLWALSKASGRDFPIVIDTPVGRLDRRNRWALFEKYLPHAGHQVIVLSTDTEVDIEATKKLAPHVARQYRLEYDPSNESTVIRVGYFF
jgi:DNA sulfur modification protein DndD